MQQLLPFSIIAFNVMLTCSNNFENYDDALEQFLLASCLKTVSIVFKLMKFFDRKVCCLFFGWKSYFLNINVSINIFNVLFWLMFYVFTFWLEDLNFFSEDYLSCFFFRNNEIMMFIYRKIFHIINIIHCII